jgi:hypothetical protein
MSAFSVYSLSARSNLIISYMSFIICVHSRVLIVLYFILCDFHEKGRTDFPQTQGQIQNSRRCKCDAKQVILRTHRTKLNRKGGLALGDFLHLMSMNFDIGEYNQNFDRFQFWLRVRTMLMTLDTKTFVLCVEYVERFATSFVKSKRIPSIFNDESTGSCIS